MMLMLHGLFAQYTGQVNYNPADVNTTQTDGWDLATIAGCDMETDVGKPCLPIKQLHIAIPEDKAVTGIQILNIQQQELTGTYNIMPTQPGQIPGEPEPDFVVPNQDTYGVNAQYPAEYIYSPTAGFKSGVHIAGVLYYPLTYNPVTQKLYLTTHLEYQLVYANEDNNPVKPRRMLSYSFLKLKEEIKAFTENPSDVDTYFQLEKTDVCTGAAFAPDEFPNFNGQPVEYVIITNQTLAAGFQEIADWKTQKGVPAVVRTVEWIYDYYSGVDQAEKVRNFIIDACQNWGVQYVMLGGDSDIVPVRYAWHSHFNHWQLIDIIPYGEFIPADMYYSCLVGNWNADGDAIFGESDWSYFYEDLPEWTEDEDFDLVDRLPDIKIGRIPVEDYFDNDGELVELERFKAKFFEYIKTSQGNENNVLLFSADSDDISSGQMNIVSNKFPGYVNITKLYEITNHTNTDVLNHFNADEGINYNFISGYGHGGYTSFEACVGSLNRTDMDNLQNPDNSEILYLTHCSTMEYDKNCVAEHFINAEHGGVAVLGNTRFGWTGHPNKYTAKFIDNLYNVDHIIGQSFNYIKGLYQSSSYKDGYSRWEFFALNMSSDPEMPIWTDNPDTQNPLIVNVPTSVNTGEQNIPIQVSNLTTGIEASVCLYREGEIYAVEYLSGTGSTVSVNMDCTPNTVNLQSDILVTVTAKNYLPVEKSIAVTANPLVHLYTSNHTISGDENIDAGETIDLNIELSNSGLTVCNGVSAVLSSADTIITINNNQLNYGNIPAGGSVTVVGNFTFTVDAALIENQLANFTLTMTDAGNNEYTDEIYLEVCVPELSQRSKRVVNTSNGDEIIEAGETVWFDIDLHNNSHSLLQNVNAVLSSTSGYVSGISQNQGSYGNIASFETETNTTQFCFSVAANYPGEPEPLEFILDAANGFGQQWQFSFNLLEKPDISDIEIVFRGKLTSIALFWTVYDGVAGYNIYRSDTETGSYALLNTNGLLTVAYFEDAGLGELTEYYYKVTAISPSGNESEPSDPKHAWTSLAYHPDWLPITVTNEDHGGFWGAPNVYDLEGDGEKEIFITSGRGDQAANRGTIFGFQHDGEELYDIDENPTSVSGFANIGISMTSTPAIGDIDNDGVVEIVVATRMGDPDIASNRKLLVYKNEDADNDGIPDLMWETPIHFKNFNGEVLADLNHDNLLEIIVPNQLGNKMEVFDCYGSIFNGWSNVTTNEDPTDDKAVSMPVAVDLDGNGDKEIVIGLEAGIYIWNHDGTDFITNQNPVYTDNGRLDCPVIAADIDNDNDFEILFMSIRGTTGYIYAIENDGSLVTGWDDDDHNIELSIQSQTWAWPPAFVCGDVDLDGNIEVIIADKNYLKVWDNAGTLVLEKPIPTLQCQYLQPIIADVNGTDDACEIIVPSNNGTIYAFKLNGNPVLGWPLYLSGGTNSDPYIGDIDNDGKNEVVAASGNDIFVWDSEGEASLNQWGSFRLNAYNNAVYVNGCHYNTTPLVVDSDETWNSDKTINSDVIVEADATLTVSSCLRFADNAKLIIKPGAELVLDGAILTNACNGLWQGIEVWGNPASAFPSDQGWLTIKNGALIENAKVAIRNHHYNDELAPPDSHQGGIVKAFYSTFRNNTKAMDFRNYNHYSHNYIKDCEFIYDGNYLDSEAPGYFIEARYMKSISIISSDFSNNTSKAYNGRGIYSYKTNIAIKGKCISQTVPCNEWENNTFNNLVYGIYAMDNAAGKYVDIRNSTFNQCQKGVYISGMDGARVTSNEFNVPQYYTFDIEKYGLYLNNATAYHVEDNDFFGPSPSQKGGIGVYVNNSGTNWNQIYNNRFENLKLASVAYGVNRNANVTGLCFKCNDYQYNAKDIIVNGKPYVENHGIARYQGSFLPCASCPAGNTFSGGADVNLYNSDGMEYFTYIYHGQNPTGALIMPISYYSSQTMNLAINWIASYEKESSCPSKLDNSGGIGIEKDDERDGIADAENNASQKEAQLAAWVDDGDTEGLNFDVLLSSPPEAGEVYQDLMNQAPFISDTVLKTAISKENVLINAMIRDVLVASPQSAKNIEILNAIDERFEPMPQWMKNQVLEGVNLLGAKEAVEAELSTWKQKRGEHFNNLYQYFRKDTLDPAASDSLEVLLANDPCLDSKYRLAFHYYQRHDYISMSSILSSIPSDYVLTSNQQAIHQDYLTLFGMLEQLSGNELLVDSVQAVQLESLIERDEYFPGAYARDILFAAGFIEYEEPIVIPEILKSSEVTADETFNSFDSPEILNVFPNPANDYVVVDYIAEGKNGIVLLSIIDLNGKPMFAEVQNEIRNQKVISTTNWKSGIYLVTVSVNGSTIKSRKLTIK